MKIAMAPNGDKSQEVLIPLWFVVVAYNHNQRNTKY